MMQGISPLDDLYMSINCVPVDCDTLDEKPIADDSTLVLIALKTDNVRLIDNCLMK